jgi:hypothetical protein
MEAIWTRVVELGVGFWPEEIIVTKIGPNAISTPPTLAVSCLQISRTCSFVHPISPTTYANSKSTFRVLTMYRRDRPDSATAPAAKNPLSLTSNLEGYWPYLPDDFRDAFTNRLLSPSSLLEEMSIISFSCRTVNASRSVCVQPTRPTRELYRTRHSSHFPSMLGNS